MNRQVVWAVVGVVLGLILAAGAFFARPYTLRGSEIDPPVAAPDVVLPATDGSTFRLADQQGRLVVMFFGYTFCPDVCPATLSEMKQAAEKLGPQAGQVRFVFITVDPQRDSVQRLQAYLNAFHPDLIGLSGSEAELQPVWNAYGVFRAVRSGSSPQNYLVDHSARTYLIDRQGRLRLTYSFGTPVDDLVGDIRHLLKER